MTPDIRKYQVRIVEYKLSLSARKNVIHLHFRGRLNLTFVKAGFTL